MMRWLQTLFGFLVISAAFAPSANAGCVLYTEKNFSGQYLALVAGFPLKTLRPTFERKISSVRVLPGCRLTAYKARNFEGEHEIFLENRMSLSQNWAQKFQSLKCACKGKGENCMMFDKPGLEGAQLAVGRGGELKDVGTSWKDKIASISVPHGCALTGYVEKNFRGEHRTFHPGEHKSLTVKWDNEISSAECKCGEF